MIFVCPDYFLDISVVVDKFDLCIHSSFAEIAEDQQTGYGTDEKSYNASYQGSFENAYFDIFSFYILSLFNSFHNRIFAIKFGLFRDAVCFAPMSIFTSTIISSIADIVDEKLTREVHLLLIREIASVQ